MSFRCASAVRICTFIFAALVTSAHGQNQNQPAPNQPATGPSQPTYTIQAQTRVVLTDVTVTDAKGNPVHGLPQSAFQVFDNNKPQAIASFEEHSGTPAATAMPASTTDVYSNDYLLHLPPVLSVIVIDIANLEIPEQMYLNYELTQFLNQQPVGQPLAIYLRAGSGCFVVQNFTSDRALLLAAIHKAIPRFPPTGREYLSDIDTLHQIALSLSQLPGRKNILWFSGGSTLFLREDATIFENSATWRNLYDELEQERIAVYPIDARGLTVYSGRTMFAQQTIMYDVAQATGGHAFYNSNGLKEIANKVLSTDGSFYTLTYSPPEFRFNNKWHKVHVKLDEGSYQLSYRSGYFADGSIGGAGAEKPTKPRTRLMANGEKFEMPALRSQPIIFQARVLPASDPSVASMPARPGALPPPPPSKGSVLYSIHYALPVDALTRRAVDGKHKIVLGVAAISFNRDGRVIGTKAEQVSMDLNDDALRLHPDLPVTVDQWLNLSKDDQYLYLAVWDMTSGRLGTLQMPIAIPKPPRAGHNS